MKVVVKCADLINAVSKVVKAVSSKTTNPALEGIKLSAVGDTLTLSATDLEIAIEKTIVSETFMEGEVLVLGKLFSEFIRKIDEDEDVDLSTADGNKLKISYGQADTVMQCLDVKEFPIIDKDTQIASFTMEQTDFKDMITQSAFACSQDFSRPILRGCLLETDGNRITCVALDGFRLAIVKKDLKESSQKIKVIIPARALLEITKLIEKENELISIIVQDKKILVEVENTILVTRVLDGEFINYKQIIPPTYSTNVKVSSKEFKDSIERASIVARDAKNMIKIDIKEGFMNISSVSEVGNVNENIPIKLEGQDMVIAFNSRYIVDCINAIGEDTLNLNLNSSIAPCVIKPVSGDDYMYMILPIRING